MFLMATQMNMAEVTRVPTKIPIGCWIAEDMHSGGRTQINIQIDKSDLNARSMNWMNDDQNEIEIIFIWGLRNTIGMDQHHQI